jgi:hypothetical protein
MTVSEEFVGAWRRVGLVIDGIRRVDYCDVLWLQSSDWFADIRTLIEPDRTLEVDHVQYPFAQEFSFAGTTEFKDPTLCWRHLLDSRGDAPLDENSVAWQDRLLIESGFFESQGREVPFIEEWGFLGREGVLGSGADGHVRVEAAGFAIEVRQSGAGFSAVKHRRSADGWQEHGRVQHDA